MVQRLSYQYTWYYIQPFFFPPSKDLGPPPEVALTRLNESLFEAGLSLPHCLLHWCVWGRSSIVSRDCWSGHEQAAWVEWQPVFIVKSYSPASIYVPIKMHKACI